MNSQGQIFIVEDKYIYSYGLEAMLMKDAKFKIKCFSSGEECIKALDENPGLIILDNDINKGMSGIEVFTAIHSRKPEIPVIIISSPVDVQVAIDLLKLGIFDYIEKKDKEHSMDKLHDTVLKAIKSFA